MASSAQTLTTNIVINAKTGNGFSQVGATLTELGSIVNGMSQQLITFGKESIDTYREYEKSMREAEVALSTQYGRGTKELANYMSQIDTAATEWAATTIFHTDDVANAIAEAAHAGWGFEEIMTGIPAAMQLAQAGSLDLSEAVNYIVKSTSAAGVEFEDVGHFIDLWAYSANSSASTIGEFGDAMLRMGSTMRFAANPEELMTLMAVTANAGQVGSEAGTLIRNSMMRLVAPTKKAREVMAELGATSEEMASTLDDQNLIRANERLEQYGFSVFNQKGELKNVLDIYRELYMALGGIAGGFDDIDKNQDALEILGSIFPTRTITEALTLLRAAADGYDNLYSNMKKGAAEGYGAYAAETMMDTLDGRIETFNSKVERLKQLVGESLSGQVSNVLGEIGGFVDQIAGLDDGVFDGLVNALEVFAAAGPGLLTAGGAARLLGILFSNPAMAAGTIAMATAALGRFLITLRDAEIEDAFGNLELGDAALDGVRQLSSAYESAYKNVHEFQSAVEQSFQTYQTASSSLSGSLIENFLSGAKLSDKDKEDLFSLGEQMHTSLIDGITASKDASMSYWTLMFGDDTGGASYQDILGVTDDAYQGAIKEANNLSAQLKAALTSAFSDGHVDGDELAKIQQYMREYNDAVARAAADAANEEAQIQMQRLLNQGQGASLESLTEISGQMREVRDGVLSQMEEDFQTEYAKLQIRGADQGTLSEAQRRHEQEVYRTRAGFDQRINELWGMGLGQSEYGTAFSTLTGLADQMATGALRLDQASTLFSSQFGGIDLTGTGDKSFLRDYVNQRMADYGMTGGNADKMIQGYIDAGQKEMATEMMRLYSMSEILGGADAGARYNRSVAASDRGGSVEAATMTQPEIPYDSTLQTYQVKAEVIPEINQSEALAMDPIPAPIEPYIVGTPEDVLQQQGVDVQVDGDTSELQATIQAEDGQNLMSYVSGDASNLHMSIMAEDGRTLRENVTGNTSALAAAINAYQGRTITVNIRGNRMFASGGRATEASIFGEAGPEWAIPEEHSERTASLLNAAREASGFTWPDLLSRFGGLNAGNSSGNSQTLVYSPTINAGNAEGVEEVLRNDKDRLEGWYRDMRMRESAEVYA